MHTLDLAKHPVLRGYLRAAENGDLVLISEGALVVGYIAVPGVQLAPQDQAMLHAALDAAPATARLLAQRRPCRPPARKR